MLKKVIFWFRCIGIVWKDRNNKACRQKYRRMEDDLNGKSKNT